MATTTTTTTATHNNHGRLIRDLLDGRGVEYRYIVHEETPTSEDSARARGEDLSTGGKALVLRHRDAPKKKKGDDDDEEDSSSAGGGSSSSSSLFAVFVLSASRKLNSKAIRKEFGSKNVRFATKEELSDLTGGLVPGSVPPFGRPIIDMDLFVDASIIEENEKIAFNCGSLTESIVMSREDYVDVAAPAGVFPFSK